MVLLVPPYSWPQLRMRQKVREHTPICSLEQCFVDNFIRDKVTPIVGVTLHDFALWLNTLVYSQRLQIWVV